MSGDVPPSQMPLDTKWKHVPTTVYDQNYGFGINYYQPMIDYIDQKEQKIVKNPQLPELPWSDGRFLWEKKRILPYSTEELRRYAFGAEEQAKEHLSHFKIAKRSDFSLKKAVEATHVARDIESGVEAAVKIREQTIPLDASMADLSVQAVRNFQRIKHVQEALDHAKSLRGKSAKAIEYELKTESMKNLSNTTEISDIRKYQRQTMQALWDERDHVRMMEDRSRLLQEEDARLTQPLDELQHDLKALEIKSSTYFIDKR
ncbi:paramyosin, short form-like [Diachasmimorpha longicaudata]|uniref:paramyosin, short form-like n=1 Tax=Diachasmimorpha longicaudata TaxID=58733 RepID=UPI0030B8A044